MEQLRAKKGFICDMDGVIYHGNRLLPGVKEFVEWLYKNDKKFLFLTNASSKTPRELQLKLKRMGLEIDESHFYTSALATAKFVSRQMPGCSAYIIGDPGLFNALHDAGITFNDVDPDYVIVGETNNYNYDCICRAVHRAERSEADRYKYRYDRPIRERNNSRLPRISRAYRKDNGKDCLLCWQAQSLDDENGTAPFGSSFRRGLHDR